MGDMMNKKILVIIGIGLCLITTWAFSLYVFYSKGYEDGINSSNLDEVYFSYLDSILPEDDDFTVITVDVENDSYMVYHNIYPELYDVMIANYTYLNPLFTWQHFNDKPIFHLPRGGIIITDFNIRVRSNLTHILEEG
jgi:hypothetical protein